MSNNFTVELFHWPELTETQRAGAAQRFHDSLTQRFGAPADVIAAWANWYSLLEAIGHGRAGSRKWPEAEAAARAAALTGLPPAPPDLRIWCSFFEGTYMHPNEVAAARRAAQRVVWPQPAEPAPF